MSVLKSLLNKTASKSSLESPYDGKPDDDKKKKRKEKRKGAKVEKAESIKVSELKTENAKRTPSKGKLKGRAAQKAREKIVTKSIKAKRAAERASGKTKKRYKF